MDKTKKIQPIDLDAEMANKKKKNKKICKCPKCGFVFSTDEVKQK